MFTEKWKPLMSVLSQLGALLVIPLLAPGNIVCQLLGITESGPRNLVRMLVNSLFWTPVGLFAVLKLA